MQERRRIHRTRMHKAAKLFGHACTADCVVQDISAYGARLVLVSTASIPGTFDLSFDGARTLRSCGVVWRSPMEVGVQFQDPTFPAAA
jgi:PilZ domain